MKLFKGFMITVVCLSVPALAFSEPFDVSQVPKGKSVTLPPPALSVVSVPSTLTLKATDRKQTVKLATLHQAGPQSEVQVAIFNAHSDRVRYITLKPGSPALYSFSDLEAIRLDSQFVKGAPSLSKMTIVLESNRPLHIIR